MTETLYPHETVIGRIAIWFSIGLFLSLVVSELTQFLITGGL